MHRALERSAAFDDEVLRHGRNHTPSRDAVKQTALTLRAGAGTFQRAEVRRAVRRAAERTQREVWVTGWPLVVIAIATSVMAVSVLVILVGMLGTLRQLGQVSERLTRLLESVDRDARPALEAVRRTADETSRAALTIREEVEALSSTSRDVRQRVQRTAAALEDRFVEFDTLLDVLHDEVEDTVLDVAAVLRTTRRGAGLLRGLRRAFGRRR
jgi:methyl-accepting chemotaxis protein